MKKIEAYWAIMQELFLAPLAYLLGARAYTLYIRYADGEPLSPFTDVLFNKNIEEATVTKALDKFDELTNKLNDNKFLKDIEDMPIMYSEEIAQVIFKRLCIISEHDRKLYGKGVQEYWGKKEDKLIKEFPKVLAKASKLAEKSLDEAIDYINDWTLNLQSETIDEAKTIFDQLI